MPEAKFSWENDTSVAPPADKKYSWESAPAEEKKPVMYGRGGTPNPSMTVPEITPQSAMDAAMMVPVIGEEAALLKGGTMLEDAATRAYPKVAQFFGEHPFIAHAPKLIGAGGTSGATYNALTGRDPSIGAVVGATGSLGAEGIATAYPMVKNLVKKYMGGASQEEIEAAAKKIIQNLHAKDVQGGGLTADAIKSKIQEMRKEGKPLLAPDIAGENVRGRAGSIARVPGVGKQMAKQFFEARDKAAAARLSADIDKYLGSGSAKELIKKTAEERSLAARPLFEKAYQGGSLASLEKQYEKSWQEATKLSSDASEKIKTIVPRITMIKAKISQTANVYQQAALKKELGKAETELAQATENLKIAQSDEMLSREQLHSAQSDRKTQAPGAVWSPKIQRFLGNSEVKKGIARGMQIERNTADAAGTPFDPTEYAITGTDKEGNPIVAKVPNMRLLATAKEGLDARLLDKDVRDETTGRLTKYGLSIQKLRNAVRDELVRLNPDYAKALESWSGDSAVINAANYGRNIALKQTAEDISEEVGAMSESEKEAARQGLSDALKVKLSKTPFRSDEAKTLLNSEYMKQQLKPFFKTESAYNRFVNNVTTETTMFETPVYLKGKSPTAERVAEDEEAFDLHGAIAAAAKGNYVGILTRLKDYAQNAGWKNKAINDEIAKLLFNPNVPVNYLERPVALGEPTQSLVRKSAPYVGTAAGEALISLTPAPTQ